MDTDLLHKHYTIQKPAKVNNIFILIKLLSTMKKEHVKLVFRDVIWIQTYATLLKNNYL